MGRGNNQHTIYQDTTSTQGETIISTKNDSIQLNVNKPAVMVIPETPRRFQTTATAIKKATPKFTPSSSDSIAFNLLTRPIPKEGVLNHSIVKDYLEPIKTGNKLWLTDGTEGIRNISSIQEHIEYPKDTTLNIQNDSISTPVVNDDFIAPYDSLVKDQDSIFSANTPPAAMDSVVIEKIFPNEDIPFIEKHDKDIISVLLILSIAITGILRMTNFKYLREIFSAVIYSQEARKMQKTVNLRNRKPNIILNALFLFNTSIFVYQLMDFYNISTMLGDNLLLIPTVIGLILSYGIFKNLLYRFIGYVFEIENQTSEYLFFNSLHNKIFGLAILPIIMVVPYIAKDVLPILFKLGLALFILLYLLQIFRGISIILKNVASLFYLFLYLCALEIIPLIIVYHILVK